MSERRIEAAVVSWARKHGFLTPKVKFVESGYPDRLFISPKGHTIFIEFKVPGEQPHRLQQYRIDQLRQRNIPAFWCDTVLETITILKTALEPEAVSGEGDKADVVPIGSSFILGPRIGENKHDLSSIVNSIQKEADPQGPDCSPDASDA